VSFAFGAGVHLCSHRHDRKVVLVAMSTFSCLREYIAGIRALAGDVCTARVLGATPSAITRHVTWPSTVHSYGRGFRIAVPYAIGSAVVAEFLSATVPRLRGAAQYEQLRIGGAFARSSPSSSWCSWQSADAVDRAPLGARRVAGREGGTGDRVEVRNLAKLRS